MSKFVAAATFFLCSFFTVAEPLNGTWLCGKQTELDGSLVFSSVYFLILDIDEKRAIQNGNIRVFNKDVNETFSEISYFMEMEVSLDDNKMSFRETSKFFRLVKKEHDFLDEDVLNELQTDVPIVAEFEVSAGLLTLDERNGSISKCDAL